MINIGIKLILLDPNGFHGGQQRHVLCLSKQKKHTAGAIYNGLLNTENIKVII